MDPGNVCGKQDGLFSRLRSIYIVWVYLYAAMCGKDLHHFAPVENGEHGSTRDLDHEIVCLGSTELAPPSLVPSLYASLVGRVKKVGSDPFDSHVSYTMDFSVSTSCYLTLDPSRHRLFS